MGKERVKENFYKARAKIGKLDLLAKRIRDEIVNPCRKAVEESFPEGVSRFSEVERATDKLQEALEPLVNQVVRLESNRLKERKLLELMSQLDSDVQLVISSFEYLRKAWISSHGLFKGRVGLNGKPIGVISELLEPLTAKSKELHQRLEETFCRWRLFVEFSSSWESALTQIEQLQDELQNLLGKCLPESKRIDELIQPITSAVAHLEENYKSISSVTSKPPATNVQSIVDRLPGKALTVMRQLQEITARSVLFETLQPVVSTSISQLSHLSEVLKEIMESHRPEPEQLEGVWQPFSLDLGGTQQSPEKTSSLSRDVEEWDRLFEEIQDSWLSCVNNLSQTISGI